jgi:anthranilate synthase component 1
VSGLNLPVLPTCDEFLAVARSHGVVPIARRVLADLHTPLGVYDRVRGNGPSFLLESAEHGERWGRYSFVGFDPFLVVRSRGGLVTVESDPHDRAVASVVARLTPGAGLLDTLAELLRHLSAPPLAGVPLHGGAVGYLGYDVVREVEHLPGTVSDDLGLADAVLAFPRQVVALDHLTQSMTVVTNVVTAGLDAAELRTAYSAAESANTSVLQRLAESARQRPPIAPPQRGGVFELPAVTSSMPDGAYLDAVARIKDHIVAGDTFQTVLSQRFSVATDVDPFDLYRVLRVINPSPYLYLIDTGEAHIVGSSPEALVQVQGRRVETWPIAGTRRRGADPEEDRTLAQELLVDVKERAEHVMLVDLARNDLGRVCEPGTVEVSQLMEVERYSHVMHLVSAVTGRLREDVGPVDVLRATFPAGTVSGAPKVRAMELIDELEPVRRGPYAGAVGYLDLAGNLDTCITIRTVVLHDGVAHVQAGAGIVADSVPEREEQETRDKASAVLAAIRAAERLHLADGADHQELSP